MDISKISDASLLHYYEEIRTQVSADIRRGVPFMGAAARKRANTLLAEIQRRQPSITPIYWNRGSEQRTHFAACRHSETQTSIPNSRISGRERGSTFSL
jgi:hypothetical protein